VRILVNYHIFGIIDQISFFNVRIGYCHLCMEGHSPIYNVNCLTFIGAILGDVPVTKIASVNKYYEYFYDEFIENVDKFQYNRILDVGNTSLELVSGCQCYPFQTSFVFTHMALFGYFKK